MNLDKAQIIVSIAITSLCYLTSFVASTILFKKTSLKGFAILAVGFGLWILGDLVSFFSSTDFILCYALYLRHFGTLGLILISLGFIGLLRGIRINKQTKRVD
jgi:hypothetical protein